MGTVYRLKSEVVDFLISQKLKDPNLSCRKMSDLALKKFNIKLSKSSVNAVLRKEHLSSPVGRRTKKLVNIQGEIEHGGFSILQGIDSHFDVSKIVADMVVKSDASALNLLPDIETIVQALIIFKSIFDLTIEPRRCYDNNEIWTLVGRRPTRTVYNRVISLFEYSQLTVNKIVTEITKQLNPVSGYKFHLADGSNFFIDGQLQSVWRVPIRRRELSATYYKSISYIDEFIKSEQNLPIFNIRGTTMNLQEVLNFILALNSEDPAKVISQIELLDLTGNVLDCKVSANPEKRFFMLGFWPWQLEKIVEYERIPASKKLYWREPEIEFFYQTEELILSQHIANQEVKCNALLLKDRPIGAVRLGILTNIPQDIIHKYLSINELYHWIQPEKKYKEFMRKTKEGASEYPDPFLDSWEHLKVTDRENNLENIFSTLSKIIFYLFQKKFLPRHCNTWSPLKIKDVFLRQRAIIKRGKQFASHNILISNSLCNNEDMDYICQRLNDIHILNRDSKFFSFTYTPKSS